jgi:predicted transcriptional regulator of viral defense system
MANIISRKSPRYQIRGLKLKLANFFSNNPVFTMEEFEKFMVEKGSGNRWTRKALLAHHRKQGRILQIRRGLYAVVPPGAAPHKSPLDPYMIAAKMTKDAVLAYHTALELHGKAYSNYEQFFFLTKRKSLPLTFRSYQFRCVLFPKTLRVKQQENFGVKLGERAGLSVRVTSLERTLVDVLDRPDLGGGWEEIWRSLESVEFFDLDQVLEYALLLENATTVAKVGFFLDQHRETLMVEEAHLEPLHKLRPKKPHYMERSHRRHGRLVKDWNLVVPPEVLEKTWAEVT